MNTTTNTTNPEPDYPHIDYAFQAFKGTLHPRAQQRLAHAFLFEGPVQDAIRIAIARPQENPVAPTPPPEPKKPVSRRRAKTLFERMRQPID